MSEAEKQKRGFWSLITKGSIVIHLIVSAFWLFGVGVGVWWFIGVDLEAPLRPNEVGDFLAGAFSPLAFYWLIVGYWLQRQELQETRKEIQRQADAMSDQTGYLKDELELRIRLADEASARARLEQIELDVKRVVQNISMCLPITLPNGERIEKFRFTGGHPPTKSILNELAAAKAEFSGDRNEFKWEISALAFANRKVPFFTDREHYERVFKQMRDITSLFRDSYDEVISPYPLLRYWPEINQIAVHLYNRVDQRRVLQVLEKSVDRNPQRPKVF